MELIDLFESARYGKAEDENRLFEELLVRFQYLAHYRMWDRQDADEVVQSALMAVLQDYRGLDRQERFEAWAYKVLNNRILAYMKSKKNQSQRQVELDESKQGTELQENLDANLKDRLLKCLAKIRKANTAYARILAFHFQGYTTDEICQKLDITPNNLYVSLARARAALTRCLDEDDR